MLRRTVARLAGSSVRMGSGRGRGKAGFIAGLVTGSVIGAGIESQYPFFGSAFDNIRGIAQKVTSKETSSRDALSDVEERAQEQTVTAPTIDLPYLSDKVFETTDDMLVFMFPSEEAYLAQSARVATTLASIKEFLESSPESTLKKVQMFFTIVPAKAASSINLDNLEVMCYKGQRKLRSSLPIDSAESPIADWEAFFTPRSVPVDEELRECVIQHISADEFDNAVLNNGKPVLLQLYEKSCFLCFLMRPFLNSVAALLQPPAVPFTIKRLDIEENDFPERLPIVRGTPTFMLFDGEGGAPQRFEEFKPRDLVKRISRDYAISTETREHLFDLVDRVTLRFQAFSGLIMWNTEADKILDLISGDETHNATIPFDLAASEDKDKELFNKLVSEYMSDDMVRCDGLEDNLRHLLRELTHMEKHAIMMGQVLGEKIIQLENK